MQEIGQERGVVGQSLQWVRRRVDGVAVGLQPLDYAVPAAGVSPGSVLKHDGGLRPAAGGSASGGMGGGGLGEGGGQGGGGPGPRLGNQAPACAPRGSGG